MKIIKNLFALLGFAIFLCWLANQAGIGHFSFYYGADQLECTKIQSNQGV